MKRITRSIMIITVGIVFAIALLAGFWYRPSFSAVPPADWITIDAAGCFTFSVPSDFNEVKVSPIDSYVRRFDNDRLSLDFDLGQWSDPLKRYPGRRVRISGRRAWLCAFTNQPDSGHRFPEVVAVHFPDLGKGGKLTVWIDCKTKSDRETAEMIIGTIKIR